MSTLPLRTRKSWDSVLSCGQDVDCSHMHVCQSQQEGVCCGSTELDEHRGNLVVQRLMPTWEVMAGQPIRNVLEYHAILSAEQV
jgi:hypothetical protein